MRSSILLAAVALLATGGATAQTPRPKRKSFETPKKALPVFSFMGDDTETATSRTKLNESDCTTTGNLMECADYSISHLAGAPILWMTMSYNKGRLYRVMGTTNYTRFTTLLDAFTVKYGKPVMANQKWQSKIGATFDNSVARWYFHGGLLELQSRGMAADEPMFLFVSSENAPPAEKPKVDF